MGAAIFTGGAAVVFIGATAVVMYGYHLYDTAQEKKELARTIDIFSGKGELNILWDTVYRSEVLHSSGE